MTFTLSVSLLCGLLAACSCNLLAEAIGCPLICTNELQPVCGLLQGPNYPIRCSFINECSLHARSCYRPYETWIFQHPGPCHIDSFECRLLTP